MYINLIDTSVMFGVMFAYTLLFCWYFSKLFPRPATVVGGGIGIMAPVVWMYFEPGRYWVEVTIAAVAVMAGAATALWLLNRRLRKQLRPVSVSSCRCSGFSCRGRSWGSCDNGGF
jgi:hypothetical protein